MIKLTEIKYILLLIMAINLSVSKIFSQADTNNYYSRSLYELSQVRVYSEKKTTQKISNIPATVRIVTAEEIIRNGYFYLEDALAELPGFQFRNILGLNSYSFLRGLPRQNNSILVLIDGVLVNELNSGGFYGGGQYNLSNVERIEVHYGAASVLYGSNAISGIINIVTKSPGDKSYLEANTAIGNFNTYLTDLTFSKPGEKVSFQLSAMYKSSDKANLSEENNDKLWDDQLEIYETNYAFDSKITFSDFTLGVNCQNRRSSTSTYYPTQNTLHKGFGTLWNLQFINTYLKFKKEFSDKVYLQTTTYYRNATVLGNSVKEVTDTGQTAYYRPNYLLGVEALLEYSATKNIDLFTGVFVYHENLASGYSKTYSSAYFLEPEKPKSPGKTTNELAGFFAQIDYRFLRNFQITSGFRFEYSTSYKEVFTPGFTLLYNNNRVNTKLIYAHAFRAPKPWDFTDGMGNPGLEPEYLNSWELANTFYLNENFKTEVSFFSNILFDGLVKQYNTDNTNYRWVNTEKTYTRGCESGFSYINNNFKIIGFYTFTNSYNNAKESLSEIAPHSAFIGVESKFASYFNVGLRTFFFGKRKNPKMILATNSEYIDPAIVTNLYLSILNCKNYTIQLIIKNLTNTEYYHTSNLMPDRFRQPQFSFYFKLSYKITMS